MQFLRKLLSLSIYYLILVSIFSSASNAQIMPDGSEPSDKAEQLLDIGKAVEAYDIWKSRSEKLKSKRDLQSLSLELFNQGRAYNQLGQPLNACNIILKGLDLGEKSICNSHLASSDINILRYTLSRIKVSQVNQFGLQNLGLTLRKLGSLEKAGVVLETSLKHAKILNLKEQNSVELSIANLERSKFNQFKNRYLSSNQNLWKEESLSKAIDNASKAFIRYKVIIDNNTDSRLSEASKLDWLLLYTDISQIINSDNKSEIFELVNLQQQQKIIFNQYLEDLLKSEFLGQGTINQIYSKLRLSNSLLNLLKARSLPLSIEDTTVLVYEQTSSALKKANEIDNNRAKSEALGTLAKLFIVNHQNDDAFKVLSHANSLALSNHASDLAYQWEYLIAKLYQYEGNRKAANQAFESSINHLEEVRAEMLPLDSEQQFNFRDKIEPIYRDYISNLFQDHQPNYKKILSLNEGLKVAELQSYLQCGRFKYIKLSELKNGKRPTLFDVFDLGDRIEVVVYSKNGTFFRYGFDSKKIKLDAEKLVRALQEKQFRLTTNDYFINESQSIYNQLIKPAQLSGILEDDETLVFTLDSFLQNIPMSILHNGTQFLIENYAIVNGIGLQTTTPSTVRKANLSIVAAGLSEASPSLENFPYLSPISQVEDELNSIDKSIRVKAKLLNKSFTQENLMKQLEKSPKILHISSHSSFSSDPQKTFILSWDRPINILDLSTLFSLKSTGNPDLLFLSGCETAKGDRRALLGMAGAAVQSGASSTIASLWRVDADATNEIVKEFYKEFAMGKSKAQSLRLAQRKLIASSENKHPFYWSAFLLIGF